MKNTVQNLKGFRDFLPQEKRKRDYVATKIKAVFERFGFAPIETPTLEYASLLLGKYGDEADKLVYSFSDRGEREVALRYDQTVPTARVLVQYQNELPKYFRRYQIQNVFRADKPQKGRYREFTQCDCDIFGSTSPIADAEILAVYYAVYKEIGLSSIKIKINSRFDLRGYFDFLKIPDYIQESTSKTKWEDSMKLFLQSVDKLDKQSEETVLNELEKKGFEKNISQEILNEIKKSTISPQLEEIKKNAVALGVPEDVFVYEPTMVRGLDYYTGLIFEGFIPEYTVGSVGGGGRYDNLIGNLAGVSIPAVGFGIGFDRTVEAADQFGLIPMDNMNTQVLVTVFNDATISQSLQLAEQLRNKGIRAEIYPTADKLGKQFQNAEDKSIPFAIVIGEDEVKAGKITLRIIATREQETVSFEQAVKMIG